MASRNDQIDELLRNLDTVSGVLADRDQDIVTLMKNSDILLRALVARREAVHTLLRLDQPVLHRADPARQAVPRRPQAGARATSRAWSTCCCKNQNNLDESLRLMAPFYRVFANTLGGGPWFDTWISNLPPVPGSGGWQLMKVFEQDQPARSPASRWSALVVRLLVVFWPGSDKKYVVAEFPRTVSLYEGSDVKILGVAVGKVETVDSRRHQGRVKLYYDGKYKVPGRRQGRGRLAVDRRRPVHPADAGATTAARVMADNATSASTARRRRWSSTRSSAASTTSTWRSVRTVPTRPTAAASAR